MRKKGLICMLERIVLVITTISGVLAIGSMIHNYFYEKKLKAKAKAYLALEEDGAEYIKKSVEVYSPKTKQQKRFIHRFLLISTIGMGLILVFRIVKSTIED